MTDNDWAEYEKFDISRPRLSHARGVIWLQRFTCNHLNLKWDSRSKQVVVKLSIFISYDMPFMCLYHCASFPRYSLPWKRLRLTGYTWNLLKYIQSISLAFHSLKPFPVEPFEREDSIYYDHKEIYRHQYAGYEKQNGDILYQAWTRRWLKILDAYFSSKKQDELFKLCEQVKGLTFLQKCGHESSCLPPSHSQSQKLTASYGFEGPWLGHYLPELDWFPQKMRSPA